jgi:hypothetical protein
VGDEPVLINEVAASFESWDAYKKKIEFHVGPSGFSLATIDHGAWIKKVGFAFTLARIAGALTGYEQHPSRLWQDRSPREGGSAGRCLSPLTIRQLP